MKSLIKMSREELFGELDSCISSGQTAFTVTEKEYWAKKTEEVADRLRSFGIDAEALIKTKKKDTADSGFRPLYGHAPSDEDWAHTQKGKSRIMYIERKAGTLTGEARIGRVSLSKTGKTIYYKGNSYRSLNGKGFKANYYEIKTGEEYWISGPKKNGKDRLYNERLAIEIDEDVREEYWRTIRGLSDRIGDRFA